MKKTMVVAAFASAIALMFAGPAAADVGRVDGPKPYNFPAVGQGDLGGLCLGPAFIAPQLDSCVESTVLPGEDHVDIVVTDSTGAPVYFSVQQDGNDNFAAGCGSVT